MSGRVGAGPARTLNAPVQAGSDDEASTGRERIDNEVFKPRMPSRSPQLQDFEDADHND